MTDVAKTRKRMLFLAMVAAVILIALTIIAGTAYTNLNKTGLVAYMMAAPIFLTVLAFVFGYLDVNEKMKDDEITYIVRRSYIFGGILFIITILVLVALILS